jgi:Acyl-CoA reductase (LuxC)
VTPDALRARVAFLRRAGAALRRRPAREIVAALEQLLETWRDPGSKWRVALETDLAAASGFAVPTLQEGLARGLEHWSGSALCDLIERELGGVERLDSVSHIGVTGFDLTAVSLAGSIPMPSLLAVLAPLVLRSPVLVKTASRDPVTAALVARSIGEIDAELGRCVEVLDVRRERAADLEAFWQADCVVASGSDETLARIASRVRPPKRLVAHGHRVSVALLGGDATRGEPLERAADALARDIALWDQLGCLSPIALYVVGGDAEAPARAAAALARALAQAASRWPRGRVDPDAAVAFAQEHAATALRAAASGAVQVHAGAELAWVVVCEADAAPRTAPLHRFVRVHPVADTSALAAALTPLARHLAAVGMAGFAAPEPLVRLLGSLGASRVCPLGEMQAPPLAWHHDGRGVLAPLARYTDCEL